MTRREFAYLAAAPAARRMSRAWSADRLAASLLPREKWRPFPSAAERGPWEALPPDARATVLEAGERESKSDWPSLPAAVFLEYQRNGNRTRFEALQFGRRNRLRDLVVAECVEGRGRFLDQILNGLWLTCEESFWGLPAHLSAQRAGNGLPDTSEPIVDLFAAETGSLLAWTDYLLGPHLEKLSPLLRPRVRSEVQRRILTPCFERDDFWWMGFDLGTHAINNWNPWINSNWLACALLMEPDAGRRAQTVQKILRSLDVFLDSYAPDGGCDEGPTYWGRAGASLFDCLELLHSASAGSIDFFGDPLVKEIGLFPVRVFIAGDRYVNFADASARPGINGDLLFRYGVRVKDDAMQRHGAWTASRQPLSADGIFRQIQALYNLEALRKAPHDSAAFLPAAWMPGIQVMTARQNAGPSEGFFVAAQGGHNAESHNHNDVGNFIVFKDGQPILIDIGVESYTAKTFSSQRYEIWTMQSAYHNVPSIAGVMQGAGRNFEARDVSCSLTSESAQFRLDLAAAYPPEAGLRSWKRAITLDRRAARVQVDDNYQLARPADRIELSLMTPIRPVISGAISLGATVLKFEPSFKPLVDEIEVTDARLRPVWGDKLYRIRLVAERPPLTGQWRLELGL
jgi:hypothetical protein